VQSGRCTKTFRRNLRANLPTCNAGTYLPDYKAPRSSRRRYLQVQKLTRLVYRTRRTGLVFGMFSVLVHTVSPAEWGFSWPSSVPKINAGIVLSLRHNGFSAIHRHPTDSQTLHCLDTDDRGQRTHEISINGSYCSVASWHQWQALVWR
jgi:hypothetical protein